MFLKNLITKGLTKLNELQRKEPIFLEKDHLVDDVLQKIVDGTTRASERHDKESTRGPLLFLCQEDEKDDFNYVEGREFSESENIHETHQKSEVQCK